jgi:hypothetical protein
MASNYQSGNARLFTCVCWQLTDWMAHVPVEGKFFLLIINLSIILTRFVVLAKNFKTYVPFPCSSIIKRDLSEIVRDISAFAHIPSQQLYIFPGGNNKNKFLFRHHLLTTVHLFWQFPLRTTRLMLSVQMESYPNPLFSHSQKYKQHNLMVALSRLLTRGLLRFRQG